MEPTTMLALAQAGAGAVQTIVGGFQKGKAKRIARANKRPVYKIQKPILDNQELIESRAGQGISDAGLQVMKQENERGVTSAIDAILAGGGSVNNIADLYSKFSDGTNKMALIDEEMRTRNVQNLITQNNQLAGEQDKAWQVNVFAPYADKAQAAAALTNQGSNNIWKGVNTMLSAGANYATSQQYADQANNVYNQRGQTPATTGNNMIASPGDLGMGANPNQFNWYMPQTTTPTLPPTPQQQLQLSFPGLMMGSGTSAAGWEQGGFDMNMFGG